MRNLNKEEPLKWHPIYNEYYDRSRKKVEVLTSQLWDDRTVSSSFFPVKMSVPSTK